MPFYLIHKFYGEAWLLSVFLDELMEIKNTCLVTQLLSKVAELRLRLWS